MDHHRLCGITHHVDTLVEETCPILIVGRHARRAVDMGDGIDHVHGCGMLHGLPFHYISTSTTYIGEHTHEQSVIQHGCVEQLFLLGRGELLITRHAPIIAHKESCERIIISGKDGLAAGTTQYLGITEVVHQAQIRLERTRQMILIGVRQFPINAAA